jgi:hypothetical protein
MLYHVHRAERYLGQHDARTLRTLVNAGVLKLTDVTSTDEACATSTVANCIMESGDSFKQRFRLAICVALVLGLVGIVYANSEALNPATSETVLPGFLELPLVETPLETVLTAVPQEKAVPVVRDQVFSLFVISDTGRPVSVGSAVVAHAEHRLLATSWSLIQGASRLEIRDAQGRKLEGDLHSAKPALDLALLRVEQPLSSLPTSRLSPALDSRLHLHSAAGSGRGAVDPAVVEIETRGTAHCYHLDTPLAPARRGSAATDAEGRLLGLVIQGPAQLGVLRWGDVLGFAQEDVTILPATAKLVPAAPTSVQVIETQLRSGELHVSLRSTSALPPRRALLRVRYLEPILLSGSAEELEQDLTAAAVKLATLEASAAEPAALRQAQAELSRISRELEIYRSRHTALASQQHRQEHRSADFWLDLALGTSGQAQAYVLDPQAPALWQPEVLVLDVEDDAAL